MLENKNLDTVKKKLKQFLALNIQRSMLEHNWSFQDLTNKLISEGADVKSEHAVRAWARMDEKITFPSIINLVALSQVLNVKINELLGIDISSLKERKLFRVVRRPDNNDEEKIISLLTALEKEYRNPKYSQASIPTFFSFKRSNGHENFEYYSFNQILFTNFIDINTEYIKRDQTLEAGLLKYFSSTLKNETACNLDDVRVFLLPNLISTDKDPINGIPQGIFFFAVARYLEETIKRGARIGLAGGKTIASLMRLISRNDTIRDCEIFPLIHTGDVFTTTPISSSTVVSELLFRLEDFGVRMRSNIFDKKYFNDYLSTSDALIFTLGNNRTSTFFNILKNEAKLSKEEADCFVGDVLFNLITHDGVLIDDIIASPGKHHKIEVQAAKKITQTSLYKNFVLTGRAPLDQIMSYSKESDHKIVVVVAGEDKKEILVAFKKLLEPDMSFSLITESSLARVLV